MEVSGKIIRKLPLSEGIAKSSGRPWKKQEYVLETHDTYPRMVKFDFFGDRVDQYNFEIGDEVTISFDIESREFNERWYTDIHAWKGEKSGANQTATAPQQVPPVNTAMQAPAFTAPDNSQDDLPF